MARYVALLRGINVGGKNLIKMADLKACLEGDGFEDVVTYIQSGNVRVLRRFESHRADLPDRGSPLDHLRIRGERGPP